MLTKYIKGRLQYFVSILLHPQNGQMMRANTNWILNEHKRGKQMSERSKCIVDKKVKLFLEDHNRKQAYL